MQIQTPTMKSLSNWTCCLWIVLSGFITCGVALHNDLDCTFEESACGWHNDPRQGLQWERRKGQADLRWTGPSVDHTLGSQRGHFMSVSTAGHQGNRGKQKSLLNGPVISSKSLKRGACLQFWYFMYGSFVEELNVLASFPNTSLGGQETMWTRKGSQGPEWKYVQVQLPRRLEDIMIIFQVTVGTGGAAVHAAIDDVNLIEGVCQPSLSCDFESGFCGYEQLNTSALKWIWSSPNEDVIEKGVYKDNTLQTSDGHFLYLDLSSSQNQTERSSLTSPVMASTPGSCFYFWYNIISDVSKVSLKISFEQFESFRGKRGSTISLSVSTLEAYKGQGWQLGSFNVSSPHEFRTSFLVRSVPGENVTLFLDDFDVIPGLCPSTDICDFEHPSCSWQNINDGQHMEWIRGRGGELHTVSSTRVDHTLKTVHGKYLLLDSNARRGGSHKAKLISKRLKAGTEYCLNYWYLMEASRASKINIVLDSGKKPRVILTLQNQEKHVTISHLWRELRYNISSSSEPFYVVIEGNVAKVGKNDIALDDLAIQEGRCPSASTQIARYVFQCKRAQKALTQAEVCDFHYDCPQGKEEIECGYDCNFEDSSYCQWSDNSAGDVFWSVANGRTYSRKGKSYIRGLSRDHTKSNSQGHFMVVSNDGKNIHDDLEAVLISPVLQRASLTCKMTFYYIITKPGAWSMSVEKEGGGHAMTHFHLTNTTARYWRRVVVSLGHTGQPFQVSIRVRNSKQSSGTIAVDDVKFRDCDFPLPSSSCNYWNRFQCRNGACVNSNVVCNFEDNCGDNTDERDDICLKYSRCDFERDNDMCAWTQEENGDDFDWILGTGKSLPRPIPDHTTGFSTGHFIKITGHSRLDGDRARLLSAVFESTRNCKMSFYVLVNGTDLDMLNVYTRIGPEEDLDTKLTVKDVNGIYWVFKTLSIASEVPFQIILEGILGKGEHRYIAIDDISLSPECVASKLSFKPDILHVTELAPSPCSLTNQWQCVDGSQCIFLYQRCDFRIDCPDKSDEINCGACDFESSACGWRDISRGKYIWNRENRTITGAKLGHKNQPIGTANKAMILTDGGSMYVRSSLLKSPEYGYTEPTCNIFFHFCLEDTAQLSLYVYPSNTSNFESTEFGHRLWHYKNSAHWRRAAVNIGSLAAGFVLVFRNEQKKGAEVIQSAIDDVSFSPSCSRDSPPCEFQCQSTDRCVPLSLVCDMAYNCRHGDDETHCSEYQRFDFEKDVGGFTYDANSDFYWKRTSWSGEKSPSVPVRDHTLGTSFGYFLAIPRISDEISYVQKARMESPIFYPSFDNKCSMRFFYHSGGDQTGVIRIFTQIHENGELSKAWEMEQPSNAQWSLISVSLNSNHAFRVVIEGARTSGYLGGLAIDDLSFTPGCFQTNLTSLDRTFPTVDSGHCLEGKEFSCDFKCVPVNWLCDFTTQCLDGTDEAYCPSKCNFENGVCSWVSEERSMPWEIGWAKLYGIYDHSMNNESGHFAIVKSGDGLTQTKLFSPLFSQSGPDCTFSFWYRTGRRIASGDIRIIANLRRNGYDEMLLIREISSGSSDNDQWKHTSIVLPPCMGRFQLSLTIVFGVNSSNDSLMIDDISFDQCANQPEIETQLCQEPNQFLCADGRCISGNRTCDLHQDCCDGSDEEESLCFGFTKSTFESGLEGWTNSASYTNKWVTQSALKDGQPNKNFPLYDHTKFSPLGGYLTMSKAKHVNTIAKAALVKEMSAPKSDCTVTFWYQMTGVCSGLCNLSVQVRPKSRDATVVHSIRDDFIPNIWMKGSIGISVRETYQLIFEGSMPAICAGQVSLDDAIFSPGCSDLPQRALSSTTLPPMQTTTNIPEENVCQNTDIQCVSDGKCLDKSFKCNFRSDCSDSSDEATCGTLQECEFDEDQCFWANSMAVKYRWRLTSDMTRLPSEGPVVDANGKLGNYVFIYESETRKSISQTSVFASPVFAHSSPNCLLKFHYFCRFFHNSTLRLQITNSNLSASTTLWQTSQDTDLWSQAQIGIGRQHSTFRVSFSVSAPDKSFAGFVALDRIHFEHCSFPPTTGLCQDSLHTCSDGACTDKHSVCDNQADCFDQSDEREAFCRDFHLIDFEKSDPMQDFEEKEIGQSRWAVWNRSVQLTTGALAADHSTGSTNGHFLYAAGSTEGESEDEAWIYSPKLRASNDSKDGCQITFYALIPRAGQRLSVGYCLPHERLPRASLDVHSITGTHGSFWQKVSFRVFETRLFQLIFMANLVHDDSIIGIDDVIYGPNCLLERCQQEDFDCESNISDNGESRMEPVYLAKNMKQSDEDSNNDQILAIIGGVFGFLGIIVLITGIVVYLHTMKIIGKPSKWQQLDSKDPKTSGYLSMDDNGSVQGEMFERSSISI